MQTVKAYLTHEDLCDLLEVPSEMGLISDEYSLIWYPPASAWQLTMKVGTKEEVEEYAEQNI